MIVEVLYQQSYRLTSLKFIECEFLLKKYGIPNTNTKNYAEWLQSNPMFNFLQSQGFFVSRN